MYAVAVVVVVVWQVSLQEAQGLSLWDYSGMFCLLFNLLH